MQIKYRLSYLAEEDLFRVTVKQFDSRSSIKTTQLTNDLTDIEPDVVDGWLKAFEEREDYRVCAKIKEARKPKPHQQA